MEERIKGTQKQESERKKQKRSINKYTSSKNGRNRMVGLIHKKRYSNYVTVHMVTPIKHKVLLTDVTCSFKNKT